MPTLLEEQESMTLNHVPRLAAVVTLRHQSLLAVRFAHLERYSAELLVQLVGYTIRIEFGERLGPVMGFRTEDVRLLALESGDEGIRLAVKDIDDSGEPVGFGRVVEPTLVYV